MQMCITGPIRNFDLGHSGALLPSIALKLSSQILTVPTQQILGSYPVTGRTHCVGVIVFSRCHFTALYVASTTTKS